MFKLLSLFIVLFSFNVMADNQCPDDVSSSCYRTKMDQGHHRSTAIKSCRNVSNDCFMEARRAHYKTNSAIKLCKNVANNCYAEVTKIFRVRTSAKVCRNVNNRCYTNARRSGDTVRASIMSCEDVRTDCRLCGGNSQTDIIIRTFFQAQ